MAIDKNRQTIQHLRTAENKKVEVGVLKEGEIAVRYNHDNPALMIEDNDKNIVEFISSAAVVTAIDKIQEVSDTKVAELSAATMSAITEHQEDYDYLLDAISSAKTDAENYADQKDEALSGRIMTEVHTLSASVESFSAATIKAVETEATARADADDALSGKVSAFSASVVNEIARLDEADEDVNDRVDELSGVVKNDIANLATLSGSVQTLSASVVSLSANTTKAIETEATARADADDALSGKVSAFSASVVNQIAELSGANVSNLEEAKKYADDQDYTLSANIMTKVNTLSASVESLSANTAKAIETEATARADADDALSGKVSAFSASVVNEIARLDKADSDNLDAAKKYADDKDYTLSADVMTKVNTLSASVESFSAATIKAIETEATARADADDKLSGDITSLSSNVVTYIDNRLSIVYKVKGSVETFANLPSSAEVGDVYNIVNSGTTTDAAIAGSGKTYPAGANFVWVTKTDENGYVKSGWDLLGGTTDFTALNELSGSVVSLSANTTKAIETEATARADADDALSGKVSAFSATVVSEIARLDKADSDNLDAAKKYADAQDYTLSADIMTKVNTLSASTESLSAATIKAIETEATARADADDALSGKVSAFSASVVNQIAELSGANVSNLEEAKKYADDQDYTLSANIMTKVNTLSASVESFSAATIKAIETEATARADADDALSGKVSAFSATVVSEIARLDQADSDNLDAAKKYADDQDYALSASIMTKVNTLSASVESFSAATIKAIETEATARADADDALSGAITAVSAVTVTAIQGAKFGTVASTDSNYSTQSDAKMSYTAGSDVTLDLSYLSIDCGTF